MADKFPPVTTWPPTSLSSSFLIFPASWFQSSYFLTGFYSYLKLVPLRVNPSLFPTYHLPLLCLTEDEVLLLSPACQGPAGHVTNEMSIAFIQTWGCPHWWPVKWQGKSLLLWVLGTGSLGISEAEIPKITDMDFHVLKDRTSCLWMQAPFYSLISHIMGVLEVLK